MVRIMSRSLSSPNATILSGVSATANSVRVALLTPASVACAERTTATRRVKGLRCSSSPFGSGLAFWKRLKASRTSCAVQGLGTFADDLDFGDWRFGNLVLAALAAFLPVRACPGLTPGLVPDADLFGIGRTPAFPAR